MFWTLVMVVGGAELRGCENNQHWLHKVNIALVTCSLQLEIFSYEKGLSTNPGFCSSASVD